MGLFQTFNSDKTVFVSVFGWDKLHGRCVDIINFSVPKIEREVNFHDSHVIVITRTQEYNMGMKYYTSWKRDVPLKHVP